MQLIRSFTQSLPDGRTLELSLHHSDRFLYLASLVANPDREDGLWTGELGVCLKPMAGKLLKELTGKKHRVLAGTPISIEAPIVHGAYAERDGKTGKLRMEPCTDYEAVTLTFIGHHKLELFLIDLENTLHWAV